MSKERESPIMDTSGDSDFGENDAEVDQKLWEANKSSSLTDESSEDSIDRREHRSRSNERRRRKRRERSESISRSTSSKRKRGERVRRRRRSSRSSSRATFDGLDSKSQQHKCPKCDRKFESVREAAEHEINSHDSAIDCTQCDKKSTSAAKLAAHILYRHPDRKVVCYYCDQIFGDFADRLSERRWDRFRRHITREMLNQIMYNNSSDKRSGLSDDRRHAALRGVGRCPHGAPVKCKNFPNCPGSKCIYSHGLCRYNTDCNKSSCPFDHDHRPRTCMSCINDMKMDRRRRY